MKRVRVLICLDFLVEVCKIGRIRLFLRGWRVVFIFWLDYRRWLEVVVIEK